MEIRTKIMHYAAAPAFRSFSVFSEGPFLRVFHSKGRFADILNAVPVYVLRNPRAALLGAANYGFAQMR